MAITAAAFIVLLYYFVEIPVKFALVLHVCSHPGFGTGISVFEGRYALNSARQRAAEKKKRRRKKTVPGFKDAAAFLKAGRYLLHHLHLEELHIEGQISAQDAAHTALICGCANSLEGMLVPLAPHGAVRFRLRPDFSPAGTDMTLCGMVSVRAGHIILAALIGAWNFITRRISNGKASN